MANQKSEYQESFGGLRCKVKPPRSDDVVLCTKSLEQQPVGGVTAARMAELNSRPRPILDKDFVTQVYSTGDFGTHLIEAQWKDSRFSDAMHGTTSTMYHPAQRDAPNRISWDGYSSSVVVDPVSSSCSPLAVPDVHKLRYMHNNYMTHDDWY